MGLRTRYPSLAAMALALFSYPASAAALFDDDSVLEVSLSGPLAALIESDRDRPYFDFTLDADGIRYDMEVRIRGKSRVRVCDFPPLRFRFGDDDEDAGVFSGIGGVKLVTQCKQSAASQTDLLEEYAAYRIFSVISDIGYRVRLLRINWVDTDNRMSAGLAGEYAFLIESDESLAERTGTESVRVAGVSRGVVDSGHAALVYVYHYLIGNTDWSLVAADNEDHCCHNGDLFRRGETYYVVPYDFDLSGLVNARYARPDPSVGISRVVQRRYRGYCLPDGTLEPAVDAIVERRAEILGIVTELQGLPAGDRKKAAAYLDKFFKEAEKPAKLVRAFERRCL
jgi:hypothetical protein